MNFVFKGTTSVFKVFSNLPMHHLKSMEFSKVEGETVKGAAERPVSGALGGVCTFGF